MKRLVLVVFPLLLAAQQIPRPEYPQPQFERELWLNLNGTWEFEFDDANKGLEEDWANTRTRFSRTILVPFAFETAKSGIGDTSFHPWVWYRRTFALPPAWQGRRVLLKFGAVDYHAAVWVNGRRAGEHEGGSVPFALDITPLVKTGAPNAVVVRAEDSPTDRHQPRGKQYWEPQSRGIFYTRTTGIWQTVWLEAAGSSYLESVRITPTVDGLARFEARIARPAAGVEFHAMVSYQQQPRGAASGALEGPRAAAAVLIRNPQLWSVAQPNLYDVTFELRQGAVVLDRVRSYFGFRRVAVEGGRVTLNGRPTYLKFLLDQGYWPESTLTPPSDDALVFDIKAAKAMGFNGVRKHQKVEDPRFLYWADQLGFLVSGEIANAYAFDETYAMRFTREWMEAVARDYNHPSVILWVPINESWGVDNLNDPRQTAHLRALYSLTHSLDATRLVIDNDGWEHTDLTDLFGIHDYARSGELLWEKYKDLGKPGMGVPDNARRALAPGFAYNGAPVFLSEFGGIAYIPPGTQVPPESWGYSGVEKTPEDALQRLASLYEAIARIPAIIGICYTQLTDVEQEVNGLFTYDRQPKFDYGAIRALNEKLR